MKYIELNDLEDNKEYRELIPRPSENQMKLLQNDINKRGIEVPIKMNEKNVILDGYTRFDIAKKFKINKVKAEIVKFDTVLEEKEYVIRKGLLRRHLTSAQRTIIALELEKIYKKINKIKHKKTIPKKGQKGFQKSNDVFSKNNTLSKGSVRDTVAKQVGVSSASIHTAESVKKIDEILKNPEGREQVIKEWEDAKAGKTSVKHVQETVNELKAYEEGKPISSPPICDCCNNDPSIKRIKKNVCKACFIKISKLTKTDKKTTG
jgi:hypothetical protein